jgi:solute carrier family 8 (sodium/calcium exchanger)
MREFLIKNFGTTKVQDINEAELKNKLEGTKLIERIGYRRKTGFLNKKEIVPKGAVIRRENRMATTLEEKDRNPNFGFTCLHHSVSEGARYVRIKIEKKGNVDKVGVRTKDGDAISGKDYGLLNEIMEFKQGKKVAEVQITIFDDEQWEPDEDFYVELFDPDQDEKPRLPGADTRTTVTILDDDKPGVLAFKEKGVYKHIATDKECRISVQRLHAADGIITCQFKTIEISKSDRTATPGKDYIHTEGTLTFESGNQLQEIVIEIPQRENDDKKERDEIFGVQIFDA